MTIRFLPWPCLLVVWISACAAPAELPETASTVRELYRQAMPSGTPAPMPRPLPAQPGMGSPFMAEVDRQLRRDFREFPNPRLILYVYPHLTADGIPVPGYATWFNVFERGPTLKVVR